MNLFTKVLTTSLFIGLSASANANSITSDMLSDVQSRVSENIQSSLVELKINTKKALVDSLIRTNKDIEIDQPETVQAKKDN
ncbi:hypothetical protein [Pseudoalteromonas luteoviolacea]|uniref:Uncharacterized protein n=1 Tax=Pseudoalteromonas luteoviolacea S4054 TaxID=1129367 RepID=A0A0F6AFU8_9GAMM|nr:hypothetical protein [Pseudoalteromonas luteoviolacea]AOT09209.1 hypothetical protein S4054249_15750 [Pseudoalteromonas luteoviolacea]AOT14121.1 hypothetical protein S40542_15720 [Pseudoalteromonas luteoviolacea]AOT19037.1 hypothetical protein S4054_15725 [Pseudoalteromonas luteoviolacea]KKE85087.1 hypothetical protein N479_06530 [Pseudoalteromonas luteoviolacea S4054]KZN70205.1 hypothetical protein N481_01640 [Pseudoalteromonas luteoviolacea S4047-1]